MRTFEHSVQAHTISVDIHDLSKRPSWLTASQRGQITVTLDQLSELLPMFEVRERQRQAEEQIGRCFTGDCRCWSMNLRAADAQLEQALVGDDPTTHGNWILGPSDSELLEADGLHRELAQTMDPPGQHDAIQLTAQYDPDTQDGSLTFGHVTVALHRLPAQAAEVAYWLTEPADIALVRETNAEFVRLLGATMPYPSGERTRVQNAAQDLEDLAPHPQLCDQAHALLKEGWSHSLSELADTLLAAHGLPTSGRTHPPTAG